MTWPPGWRNRPNVAVDREDLRRAIAVAKPMTRLILGMIAEGMTHSEISTELGITTGAIGGRLRRLRQRILEERLQLQATPIDFFETDRTAAA
jgi:DNA-directed RNA polymerase specialized sigma24 family protein